MSKCLSKLYTHIYIHRLTTTLSCTFQQHICHNNSALISLLVQEKYNTYIIINFSYFFYLLYFYIIFFLYIFFFFFCGKGCWLEFVNGTMISNESLDYSFWFN